MSLDGARVAPRDFPVNAGGLCQKGWTSGTLLTSPARLTPRLVRVDGELVRAAWDAALDLVARRLAGLRDTHGPDSVAVFGGGGLTNEEAYALGKLARVALGTSQIDYNGRFCMSSAAAAGIRAFGTDRGLPFPLADIARADAVLLVGSNAADTMPPFARWLAECQDSGGALIVVDPRRTSTARRARLHLQLTPNTDLALALGLLHLAISSGAIDTEYVARRTTGFDDVQQVAATYWPKQVER